jgi:DNA-binding transcriptional regulator YiaG
MTNREIRRVRVRLLMTQKEFARKCEVARETVARWESGAIVPSFKSERRLRELRAGLISRRRKKHR